MVKFLGASRNVTFLQFRKIMMVSDKSIHKAFRIHKTIYKQNLFKENFFIFTLYQNYTLGDFKYGVSLLLLLFYLAISHILTIVASFVYLDFFSFFFPSSSFLA